MKPTISQVREVISDNCCCDGLLPPEGPCYFCELAASLEGMVLVPRPLIVAARQYADSYAMTGDKVGQALATRLTAEEGDHD